MTNDYFHGVLVHNFFSKNALSDKVYLRKANVKVDFTAAMHFDLFSFTACVSHLS